MHPEGLSLLYIYIYKILYMNRCVYIYIYDVTCFSFCSCSCPWLAGSSIGWTILCQFSHWIAKLFKGNDPKWWEVVFPWEKLDAVLPKIFSGSRNQDTTRHPWFAAKGEQVERSRSHSPWSLRMDPGTQPCHWPYFFLQTNGRKVVDSGDVRFLTG